METLALRALHRPTSTSFRMFIPFEVAPTYCVAESHLVSVTILLLIPVLVSWEKRCAYLCPAARLLEPWTLHSHPRVSWTFMFVRIWLLVAIWNAAVVQHIADENWNVLCLKAASLGALRRVLAQRDYCTR
ncbi:hypothetical protein GGR56DRAFT_674370 [Xylariaceae sp. FL0804]|nr:hypothetical protein GGR56DRAFT_674370 [Xylariaceae sp. FL0804]